MMHLLRGGFDAKTMTLAEMDSVLLAYLRGIFGINEDGRKSVDS